MDAALLFHPCGGLPHTGSGSGFSGVFDPDQLEDDAGCGDTLPLLCVPLVSAVFDPVCGIFTGHLCSDRQSLVRCGGDPAGIFYSLYEYNKNEQAAAVINWLVLYMLGGYIAIHRKETVEAGK